MTKEEKCVIFPREIYENNGAKYIVLGACVHFVHEKEEFILVEKVPPTPYDHFQRIVPKEFFLTNFKQVAENKKPKYKGGKCQKQFQ